MDSEKKIEAQLEQLAEAIPSGRSFVDGVMNRIETSSDTLHKQSIHISLVRRLCMKTSVKFAAAAIVLFAAFVSLTLFKGVTPAYAIEQTIEASRSLRFIHLKCEPAGEGVEEIWVQFDENGQLEHLRMNFPHTADGPKDVVWEKGKAEVWLKAKKIASVLREEAILDRLKMSYSDLDPKVFVEKLYQAQKDKTGQIEIQESQSPEEPIMITSTWKNFRKIYQVNPQTRLLEQIENFELENDTYKSLGTIKYLDYNQPTNPDIFVLKLPDDVMRIDQTTQTIGLEQEQMTNDQAAVETARRFWQAIIDGDFDKAGQYAEGISGDFLKKSIDEKLKVKFIEIVSVGPAAPHPNPKSGGVVVPCTLKVQKDGQVEEMTFERFGVRQVYNQPGRWTIFGGI